jgi:nitrogenase molybdenum-iron protein alpha/beta subunit
MTCRSENLYAILPDGFTGAMLAGESILDGAVILHGPTGCRGHHSMMSEHTLPRDDVQERLNFLEPFYFGQPRIPTTHLDGDDFVFGAKEKLVRAFDEVARRKPSALTIVNSPGAALIGDNIAQAATEAGVSVPHAIIEMPALSCSLAEGYQQALLAMLEALSLAPAERIPKTVALVGLSIAHPHWAGGVAELRRLLGLCGIETLCALGAGASIEEWRRLPQAACYAVIHDEYANRVAPWLMARLGGAMVTSDGGAPIGFATTANWVAAVARAAGVDPSRALEEIDVERRRVSRLIGLATGSSAILKGMTFAVAGDLSLAFPLARWLYDYLGMLPVAIEAVDERAGQVGKKMRSWLSEVGCSDAWQRSWRAAEPDVLFADGQQVEEARVSGIGGIEVLLPTAACLDIVPKAILGSAGAAWLIERLLNELRWVLWV